MEKETPNNKISAYKIKKMANSLPEEEAIHLFENLAKEQEKIIQSNKTKESLPMIINNISSGASIAGIASLLSGIPLHLAESQDANISLAIAAACVVSSFVGYMAGKHISKIDGYDKETISKNINEAQDNLDTIKKIQEEYNYKRGM